MGDAGFLDAKLTVEGAFLVRVLAVAQVLHLLELKRQDVGEPRLLLVGHLVVQPRRDGAVVARGVQEHSAAEIEAGLERHLTGLLDLVQHPPVVSRRADHGHIGIVLGS